MKTWLVLDVHYLCHRAFHTTHGMSHKSKATGVVFGFLKSITQLKDEFGTDDVVFCFEHPKLFRRDVYPPYKRKRAKTERTDEEKAAYDSLVLQISELRQRYLPRIGFKNIFSYRGMESDDTMAEIAHAYGDDNKVIIVTADKDLLQCLGPNVTVWNPQQRVLHTDAGFRAEYRIRPRQWAVVKAIAGCTSDEVAGIPRVGDITALKYLRGELKETSAAYKAIMSSDGKKIIRRNRQLVELPYRGCPTPELETDEVDRAGWREVCAALGMKSLLSSPPILTRKRAQYGRR